MGEVGVEVTLTAGPHQAEVELLGCLSPLVLAQANVGSLSAALMVSSHPL